MRVLIAGAPGTQRDALRSALEGRDDDVQVAETVAQALTRARGARLIAVEDGFGDDALDERLREAEPAAVVVRGFSGALVELANLLRRDDGPDALADMEDPSSFLADASPLLDASLGLRATLDSIVAVSVPQLADLCLVDVVEAGEVRRVAASAADPELERLLRALPSRYDIDEAGDDPIARVVRARSGEVVSGAAMTVFGGDNELAGHAPRSAMLAPLVARGRAIGVLALATLDAERRFGPAELALAEDLARRAALALDNALLYQRQGALARVLQESLLPERLPAVDGIELGAAFRPAGDGTVIGGDFYDAVAAPDGSLTLVIGDVSGKGATAAALTAQSRHTLRTAAMLGRAPHDVVCALNQALLDARLTRGRYCTVALCRLEPDGDGVGARIVCAGHPPPLLLRSTGEVESVGRPGTILGFVDRPDLHETPAELTPGDALLLYTDGITEARTRAGLLGDERFAAMVSGCAGMSAPAIAARLERAVVESQRGVTRDDVAIAVARVTNSHSG